MMVWLQFVFCTVVIMFTGAKLSKYGEIIAEKTGLSRTWIGVALMASVTSLPELITGLSSVVVFDLPEIAAGDVLGSCMFNILLIALLDFIGGEKPILTQGGHGQMLTAGLTLFLLGVVSLSITASAQIPVIGWFGFSSLLILLFYFGAMRLVFRYQKRQQPEESQEPEYASISKKRAFTIYALNAVVIIAAAAWLPQLGEKIAERTGLAQSFVGTLFIALSTSLPELVVTYTALRNGAVDMALGNLFGSNLFNIAILAVDDLAYAKGPLLSQIGVSHAVTAAGAIMMTAVALVGLVYRTPSKRFGFGWASVGILVIFLVVTFLSYRLGNAPN